MAQVTVQVNNKPFIVGCEDGQERHLMELAQRFDSQVRQVSEAVGQVGDARLFLMAGLMLADEIAEAQAQIAEARKAASSVQGARSNAEEKAANALDSAARRIEALAARL
jgi:cell division protein ZapA